MMKAMLWRTPRPARGPSIRRPTAIVAAVTALAASACAGPDTDRAAEAAATEAIPTTAEVPPATTAAPPTSAPRATIAPPSSTTSSSTTSTTVVDTPVSAAESTTTLVVEPLTRPVPPPADAYAAEPVVEVGSLAIPKLGVDMTMYEGVRLSTLEYGPGHWPGSAMPGQQGNVVVGGHRTSGHRVFRDLDQLASGDEIVFRSDDREHVYRVDRVEIVDPTDVWIIEPTETPTATLFACHPPGSTAQRIVVFAELATP